MMVLRIEHPQTGTGPYRHAGRCVRELYAVGTNNNPTLAHDMHHSEVPAMENQWSHHYVFGFRNPAQVINWFSAEQRRAIINEGFDVRLYEVPDDGTIQGRSQVAFDKRVAHLVGHIDPQAFLTGDLNMHKAAVPCEPTTAGTSQSQPSSTMQALHENSAMPFWPVSNATHNVVAAIAGLVQTMRSRGL